MRIPASDPLAFLVITAAGTTEDSIYPPADEPESKPMPASAELRSRPRSIDQRPQPVLRLVG